MAPTNYSKTGFDTVILKHINYIKNLQDPYKGACPSHLIRFMC